VKDRKKAPLAQGHHLYWVWEKRKKGVGILEEKNSPKKKGGEKNQGTIETRGHDVV